MSSQKIHLLALGHFCADLNQGALSAMLPFLVSTYYFSYTKAATLVLFSNLVGSLVQPIIGHLSDRKNSPWIMPLGLLLTGLGMSLTGLSSHFALLTIAVVISGTGIAMFHPQAAKTVNALSKTKHKGRSLSLFSFGGNIGFAFGPLFTTVIISTFGLKGSFFFLVPQILISIFYLKNMKEFSIETISNNNQTTDRINDQWIAFTKLCLLVFSRSIILYGLNTFLSLYLIANFHQTKASANTILSLFFVVSALSTLVGGQLSDRFGKQFIIRWSCFILAISLATFSITSSFPLILTLLIPIAIGLSLFYSPMVVLGQNYLPNHVGLASGVTLGLAVSIGGLFAPILGHIADQFGLQYSINAIAVISILAFLLSFLLENDGNSNS